MHSGRQSEPPDVGLASPPLPAPAVEPAKVPLIQILLVFAQVGISSFGGGLSAWIYRETVVRRRWLSEDAFLSGLTLAQVLPGTNVVNLSVYIGQRLRGGHGSVLAVSALVVPPMITIVLLASIFHRFAGLFWLHDALQGVAAAAIGLSVSIVLRATKRSRPRNPWAPLLLLGVFGLVGLARWPMIPVVIVLGPLAVAIARRRA
jgi:chromate transporter